MLPRIGTLACHYNVLATLGKSYIYVPSKDVEKIKFADRGNHSRLLPFFVSGLPLIQGCDCDTIRLTMRYLTALRNRVARLRPVPLWLFLFPLAWPALRVFVDEGLPRSFDGGLHLLRFALLERHIQAGNLLPRWAPELLLGYGYPLFNFYAPSAYYLAVALYWGGLSHHAAFVAAFAVAVLAAGVGMYILARSLFGPHGRWAALVAAVAYLYAPYLLTNIYNRGALSEALAQALLPWIFWSTRSLMRSPQPSRYVAPLAATLGALAVTHNITLLFVPVVLLAYLALLWPRRGHARAGAWAILALGLAMGWSAFFWLPLLLERGTLAYTAYDIAKQVWLPRSMWDWSNFLDRGWIYTHSSARPIRLGLVQLLLAVAGFALTRRRSHEQLFFALLSLATAAFMGRWALPIWQSVDVLAVAQFAWRLLSILSLCLALGAGYLVLAWPRGWGRVVVALILTVVIIHAQQPRLAWVDVFAPEGVDVGLPVFAQIELDEGTLTGGEGNSALQEFRPRWADESLILRDPGTPSPPLALTLQRAGPYALEATVQAEAATRLRFNDFYYPGMRVLLDGAAVAAYPTTNLGLMTVDVPPGRHTLRVAWAGTTVQQVGFGVTLLTLLIAGGVMLRRRRWVWLGVIAGGLALALVGRTGPPPPSAVQPPAQTPAYVPLELLAVRTTQSDAAALEVYPYWWVRETPPADFTAAWQLLDAGGRVLVEHRSLPMFNALPADRWPPGTLVDDAYRLALPPGLAPGDYGLALGVQSGQTTVAPVTVGQVRIAGPVPPDHRPAHVADARFGTTTRLAGYALQVNRRNRALTDASPLLVRPGDYLDYTLYWQATGLVTENYHGFVHLTDVMGAPLVQEDQLPGPLFQPPQLWSTVRLHPDVYRLRLPRDAPSALYWADVGLYDFETLRRLAVTVDGQADDSGRYRLPPVKLVNTTAPQPALALTARFGDLADLMGVDLTPHTAKVQPGDSLQVTLYSRSRGMGERRYVRFLQLYHQAHGVAAQHDAEPRDGGNPTDTWQPGEVVVDWATLRVADTAAPGVYVLYAGYYDRADPAARVPVYDATGAPSEAGWIALGEIEITAP